jgi:hypothetical protein
MSKSTRLLRTPSAIVIVALLELATIRVARAYTMDAPGQITKGNTLTSNDGCTVLQYNFGYSTHLSGYTWYVDLEFTCGSNPGSEFLSIYDRDQHDMNGVGYGDHQNQWSTDANGDGYMVMQYDGNFVLYDSALAANWATQTNNNSGAYINIQNDGNMVIYSSGNAPLWSVF